MFSCKIKVALTFILILPFPIHSQELEYERVESAVFFNLNSSILSESAQTLLDNMFPFDSDFYPESITLTGYTDKSGSALYNLKLSELRALSVKTYIQNKHISNTDFQVKSLGEEQMAYGCDDNLNRCVKVIMLLKEKEEPVSLDRCKELFPEEFLTEVNVPELEPEIDSTQTFFIDESNKFQKKVVSDQKEEIRLNDILFYGNSDKYYSSAEPELEQLANFLLANPDYVITITGHVNGGKNSSRILRKESNFSDVYDLSLARADSVKRFLVEKGVSSERIEVVGKGGEELLFKKPKTASESAANRRIEISFSRIEN